MNSFNLCRTCYNYGTYFHSVDQYSINFPHETLAEMLLLIAKIDATNKNDKTLPRQICNDCRGQLEIAFSFVHKSQNANKRFMLNSKFTQQNHLQYREDCLTESLIDFPSQNNWQIKIEKNLEDSMEVFSENFNDVSLPVAVQSKAIESENQIEKIISNKDETDPITVHMECKNLSNEVLINKMSGNSKNISKHEKKTKNERFSCDVCLKTFAWKKDVQRHALTHNSSPKYKCNNCERQFLRKDKLKDHMKVHEKQSTQRPSSKPKIKELALANNLYSMHPVFQMKCKLCNSNFKKRNKLRLHLLDHKNLSTLDALSSKSDVMQWFKDKTDFLGIVKDLICQDIKEQKLSRYYSIVNEKGYEMELSDTDEDESDLLNSNKYTCDLCQACFSRKYLVFEHVQKMHMLDKLPYECTVCKLQFVCNKFFQQHLRTQCQSKDKIYQCPNCFGKFMWLENLNQHICFNKNLSKKEHNYLRQIECCLCDNKFNKLSELREHLGEHASGKLPLQLVQSDYYKINRDGFKQKSEESAIDYIQNELLNENNMWRFYNAIDECGNEMDILDSENDDNDPQLIYKCSICPLERKYSQRKYLLQHQKSEHSASNTPFPFKCNACEEHFIEGVLLERHKVRDCQKQIVKKFSCKQCSASFIWDKNLELHKNYFCKNSVKQKKDIKCQEATRKLKCDECEKFFIWPKDLIRHNRIHLPENKKLQCPYCDRKFNRNDNLRRHLKVHAGKTEIVDEESSVLTNVIKDKIEATNLPKFECLECCRTFMLQRDLSRHSVMHTRDAAIHKCLWCGRKFYTEDNLLMHIERHGISAEQWESARFIVNSSNKPHGEKKLQCKICRVKDFLTISALRAHMENEVMSNGIKSILYRNYSITNSIGCELDIQDSETDEESEKTSNGFVYICEICGINFRRKYEVMQHQLTLHKWENLPYSCERCIFRTVCKEILTHHMSTQCFNIQKQHSCAICNYRFMWPDNLEQHKSKMHMDLDAVQNIPDDKSAKSDLTSLIPSSTVAHKTEVKHFQCINCKDKFIRKKSLAAHIIKKHGIGTKIDNKSAPKFLCAFCGRALSSSSNLIIHMRRHTGEKPFKCKYCEKAFPRSSDMVCHQRTHTGERPHKCTVCHKAFSRMYKLRTHMRIHSGERPYKCTFCDKSFTQSNDLALHIRRHTGERPYICGICGEGFIQSTALKNHRNLKSHFEDNVPRRGNYLDKIENKKFCNY